MEAIGRRGEEAKEEIAAKQGYGTSSYVCVRVLQFHVARVGVLA